MAAGVAYLLARNHQLRDIWGYTLRQLNGFIALASKEDGTSYKSMVWGQRIAYHVEGKEFSKLMKDMDKDDGD